MEYRVLGTRYAGTNRYDVIRHKPYDYKKDFLKQVLPEVITSTKNQTTRLVLQFVEHAMLFLISYVDELKQFKNPNYKRF